MVFRYGVGNVFHQKRLTCLGLCHDERTLSLADRSKEVNDASRETIAWTAAKCEFLIGEEGREMLKGYAVAYL